MTREKEPAFGKRAPGPHKVFRMDRVTAEVRSRMMSGIRGKDTRIEREVRSLLRRKGFGYKKHVSKLPGSPDIVLSKYRAAIFVHGCFFHGHGCRVFKWPKSNAEFWREKIARNISRDAEHLAALLSSNWRVLTVWGCALTGRDRLDSDTLAARLEEWIKSASQEDQISGIAADGVSEP